MLIQQLYLQAINLGKNASDDIKSLSGDPFADRKEALDCIQSCIAALNSKQSAIIELWKEIDKSIKEGLRQAYFSIEIKDLLICTNKINLRCDFGFFSIVLHGFNFMTKRISLC